MCVTRQKQRDIEEGPEWQPTEPFPWICPLVRLAIPALSKTKNKNPTWQIKKKNEREGGFYGLGFSITVKLEGVEGNGGAQDGTNFFELLSVASHKSHRLWQDQPTSSCPHRRHCRFPTSFFLLSCESEKSMIVLIYAILTFFI